MTGTIARPHFGIATAERPVCLQDRRELDDLIALLQRENVRSYLEIGTRYGGTFEEVMTSLPVGSRGLALDFPGGRFGDSNSIVSLLAVLARLKHIGRDVGCVLGPSSSPEILARVTQLGTYDAIFIDADHAYDAVKRDFEMYSPLGRIIVLHDIAAPDGYASRAGELVEVPRFWQEIKQSFRHLEIITPGSMMGFGIVFRE